MLEKQPQGKELYKEMLKCECSTSQESKERWNCFHVVTCVGRSLKIFREEQKTRGTKPGLCGTHYRGEGEVSCTLQHGGVLSSHTNPNNRLSNARLAYWVSTAKLRRKMKLKKKKREKGQKGVYLGSGGRATGITGKKNHLTRQNCSDLITSMQFWVSIQESLEILSTVVFFKWPSWLWQGNGYNWRYEQCRRIQKETQSLEKVRLFVVHCKGT